MRNQKDINTPKDPEQEEEVEHVLKSFVRPGSVIVVIFFFMFVVIADGNWGDFTVKEGYYPIIEAVVTTVIVAFFGMRGIEKTAREWQQNDYRYQRRYEGSSRVKRTHIYNYEDESDE